MMVSVDIMPIVHDAKNSVFSALLERFYYNGILCFSLLYVTCSFYREIQAASGEWMNEFVRRPSRKRDNRVYVPAADIIKRTIRRSWTISSESVSVTSKRTNRENNQSKTRESKR